MNGLRKHKLKGFTLVEVMLVISIIGLIFSIIVSNLQDARENSRDAAMKQQVRTTATLFEYQRNQNGSYANYNLLDVGNDGTAPTCADKNWQGEFSAKLEELCNGIVNNAEFTSNVVISYFVGSSFAGGDHFSIMTQLNTGDWYCVGSNGGTYQGPFDVSQTGCANNP